jgi:hypothetical protein
VEVNIFGGKKIWSEKFGAKNLAGKFWQEKKLAGKKFGGKILAGKIWRENFGAKIFGAKMISLVQYCWMSFFNFSLNEFQFF